MTDVLIEGMEMPRGDDRIMIVIESDGSVWQKIGTTAYFCTGYKAVALSEHGRLIDADALKSKIIEQRYLDNPRREKFYNKVLDFIFDATTILRASNKTKTPRARICPHYQGVCGLDEDILCYRYNIYEICDKYKETTECQKK